MNRNVLSWLSRLTLADDRRQGIREGVKLMRATLSNNQLVGLPPGALQVSQLLERAAKPFMDPALDAQVLAMTTQVAVRSWRTTGNQHELNEAGTKLELFMQSAALSGGVDLAHLYGVRALLYCAQELDRHGSFVTRYQMAQLKQYLAEAREHFAEQAGMEMPRALLAVAELLMPGPYYSNFMEHQLTGARAKSIAADALSESALEDDPATYLNLIAVFARTSLVLRYDYANSVGEALEACEFGLEYLDSLSPEEKTELQWVTAGVRLRVAAGIAYRTRLDGDLATNLERAVSHSRAALELCRDSQVLEVSRLHLDSMPLGQRIRSWATLRKHAAYVVAQDYIKRLEHLTQLSAQELFYALSATIKHETATPENREMAELLAQNVLWPITSSHLESDRPEAHVQLFEFASHLLAFDKINPALAAGIGNLFDRLELMTSDDPLVNLMKHLWYSESIRKYMDQLLEEQISEIIQLVTDKRKVDAQAYAEQQADYRRGLLATLMEVYRSAEKLERHDICSDYALQISQLLLEERDLPAVHEWLIASTEHLSRAASLTGSITQARSDAERAGIIDQHLAYSFIAAKHSRDAWEHASNFKGRLTSIVMNSNVHNLAPEQQTPSPQQERLLAYLRKAWRAIGTPEHTAQSQALTESSWKAYQQTKIRAERYKQPRVKQVQARLRSAAAVLIDFMAFDGQYGAFVISSEQVSFHGLARLTEEYSTLSELGDTNAPTEHGTRLGTGYASARTKQREPSSQHKAELFHALRQAAFGPIRSAVMSIQPNKIYVCAYAELHNWPLYAAALEEFSTDAEVDVALIPTAKALILRTGKSHKAAESMLCVTYSGDAGSITNVESEAKTITRLGTEAGIPGTRLDGPEATVSNVISSMRKATYIHIACHGHVTPGSGGLSGLVLADGVLCSQQVMADLWLPHVKLVTLGSCYSGFASTEYSTQELTSLANVLLNAGVQAIVSATMPIQNEAAELLFTELYKRVLTGTGVATAMRESLRELKSVHPGTDYWAAFNLYSRT